MKKLMAMELALLFLLLPRAQAALPATDNFNRATVGTTWTKTGGATLDWQIYGSAAAYHYAGTYGAMYWNADVFSGDHYSQMTVVMNTGCLFGPSVRNQAGGDSYYLLEANGSYYYLIKTTAGSPVIMTSGPVAIVTGDTITLTASGTSTVTLTGYKNGVQFVSTTDSSSPLTGGAPGLGAPGYCNNGDAWEGGNVGGASPVVARKRKVLL